MNPSAAHERIERTRALLDAGRLVDAHAEWLGVQHSAGHEPRVPGFASEEMVAFQRERLRLALDLADACAQRSAELIRAEQLEQGLALYEIATDLKSQIACLHEELGDAQQELFQLDDAIAAYRAASRLAEPDNSVHDKLRDAIQKQQQPEHVLSSLRQKVQHSPESPAAHLQLANALREFRQLDDAIESYRRVLSLLPRATDAMNNLAVTLKDAGRVEESLEVLNRAAAIAPDSMVIQSNRLYGSYFLPDDDPKRILEIHRAWRKTIQPKEATGRREDRGGGRLRIGYVSPDFRNHCQSFFTIPLLSSHDPDRVEVFCYSDVQWPDAVTERIRSLGHVWREIHGLSDERVAQQIRQDRIDVLVDLTMHMARGRPMMFALKPATVQVAWLAYPGTTGSPAMDYRFSDPYLDPPDSEIHYTEKTVRLPHTFWCYDPLTEEAPPSQLPALFNRHITFGCLNNFCKVTATTLSMWRQVLQKVPNSRLIVLAPQGSARTRVREALQIDPERIEFLDYHPREQYLRIYDRIDLCLDTFPYNGHTTSLDALWKGVPVVSLCGTSAVSRAGLSQMSNLNLSEFVAETPERFVRIAVDAASDWRRLCDIRATLRERMKASPLMNAREFARDIESAFQQLL